MKLWTRLVVAGLVVALAVGLGTGSANAQSSKKKKKKPVEEKKKVEVVHREATPHPIDGSTFQGKPGYFFSDTASTLRQGQVMGSAALAFDSWGNAFQIPVGISFGITNQILVNVNTAFYSYGGYLGGAGASGIYYLNFGGKYGFNVAAKGLKIAAGLDFAVGPLSNNLYGYSAFAFDPYGVVTYTFRDGLQLNGKLGLYVQTYNTGFPPPLPSSVSYSFFQLDLGAAYPFDRNLTGIAELATNGVVAAGGVGGTPLVVGIRTGRDVQFQVAGGLDLGGVVGVYIGGGVVLISQ